MKGVGTRRGIRKHRSYTYDEVARALGVHKNTVRAWVRSDDLPALTGERPHLIVGADLTVFLKNRSVKRKTKLALTQAYCLRCRVPREPALGMADLIVPAKGAPNLCGLCPVCGGTIHCRIPRARIDDLCRKLDVTVTREAESL